LGNVLFKQLRKKGQQDNQQEVSMNKNLFVGNLANEVTEQDLEVNFSEAGKVVSVNIIRDKFNGMSRGFGFVEMETEKDAQEAIRMFNGGVLRGKTITVNEARPKRDQGGHRSSGQGRGGFNRGRGGGRRY
jgi:RNA recognition motif-containing protein